MVSNNGCTSSDQVKVSVVKPIPPPKADAGDDLTICKGESITLTGSGGEEYLWSTGESQTEISVNPERTTTYTLTATRGGVSDIDEVTITVINCNLNNNVDDSSIVQNNTGEIEDEPEDLLGKNNLKLVVYPNPTDGIINIQGNNSLKTYNLVLTDMQGNVISVEKSQTGHDGTIRQMDLSRFAKGVYLMQLYNHDESYVEKVIVM